MFKVNTTCCYPRNRLKTSAQRFPEPGSGSATDTRGRCRKLLLYQLKFGGIVTIKAAAAIATP